MITSAFVNIWQKRIGAIAWNPESRTGSFEYDPSFIQSGLDLSPLKMPIELAGKRIFSFPELRDSVTFRGLPGLVADSFPDKYGNALINAWLTENGRSSDSLNPVELLCFIGKRGMGALEFEPSENVINNQATKIELSHLVEVARHILDGRRHFNSTFHNMDTKGLSEILKVGTSAGGARAKAVIAYNAITNEVRSGQTDAPKGFKHWLLKFDGVNDSQSGVSIGYGRIEMAYYLMAQDAGIEMTECRLLEENGRAHFMTRRFDRSEDNEKIHVQSFCAMAHYDFNNITAYSYEQLFETMRGLLLPYTDAEQLYRRMVFNVMARNCDDHTKNFVFMMDKTGEWKLAPAFDVCHAYRPGSLWVNQQSLSVNGKRNNITRDDFLNVAFNMNIRKADDIIDQVMNVVSDWNRYAEKVNVDEKLKNAINQTLYTSTQV